MGGGGRGGRCWHGWEPRPDETQTVLDFSFLFLFSLLLLIFNFGSCILQGELVPETAGLLDRLVVSNVYEPVCL